MLWGNKITSKVRAVPPLSSCWTIQACSAKEGDGLQEGKWGGALSVISSPILPRDGAFAIGGHVELPFGANVCLADGDALGDVSARIFVSRSYSCHKSRHS